MSYSIECYLCNVWYHRKCVGLTVNEIKAIGRSDCPWHCGCQRQTSAGRMAVLSPTRMFGMYVDDILRTARPHALDEILDTANSLHPSLNFTIEQEVDDQLPFLDMCV